MSPATGRREAHKVATRKAIREAAARLFSEQGYESTTVSDIARAARVADRTFYRYFEGKEDLLAEQFTEWIDALHAAIVRRPSTEPPYTAVAHAMISVVRQAATNADSAQLSMIIEGPRPMALLRQAGPRPLRRLEAAIADALGTRLGSQPSGSWSAGSLPDLRAQLLAAVAVAALRTAVVRHRKLRGIHGTRRPDIDRLLAEAFATLSELAKAGGTETDGGLPPG